MRVEIKVPVLPESVADATVSKWYKKVGDVVTRDENLVDLETDKVMLEVPAPKDGVIEAIMISEGSVVQSNEILAVIKEGSAVSTSASSASAKSTSESKIAATSLQSSSAPSAQAAVGLSPSVRRMVSETGADLSQLSGSGKGGRITKQDIHPQTATVSTPSSFSHQATGTRVEKRVPMSRLRARIAERLVEVQHSAALMTTFNEINMKPVMELRNKYKEQFEKTHGIRLGFMSFFTKAAVEALKRIPEVNASIDDKDIIYHNYCDIGIAIGTERGLVVPILRNAETLGMAAIEKAIKDYAIKAKDGKLSIEDMTGGTFTITNGGTYGSMLSTPIINPPQSAILGMHNIVDRPVVENGEIKVCPIMYVALSYDHRIIDGRESVTFLKTIKELIEDPARLLLEV